MKMADLFEKANVTDFIPFYELKEKLHQTIHDLIETDISKWSGYVCLPSCFIQSKDSEYYLENKDIADYECHHIINTQLADGSWDIAWNWDNYQNEWAISKNWWKGHLIIQNLLYLKGFDCICKDMTEKFTYQKN